MHLNSIAPFTPGGKMGEAHEEVLKSADAILKVIKANVPENEYRHVACELVEVAVHYCNAAMVKYATDKASGPATPSKSAAPEVSNPPKK